MINSKLKSLFLLIGCFVISAIVSAQTELDLDPPTITHTAPEQFSAGKDLQVDANITDDSGIEEAVVFFRFGQIGNFKSTPLTESANGNYTAKLSSAKGQKILQYYIEALDTGGNRVLEGNPSQPLTVNAKNRSNLLYVLLGAVVIGAVAAGAGGGDDGNGGGANSRTVNITATAPQ